jgi:hypothetical protein
MTPGRGIDPTFWRSESALVRTMESEYGPDGVPLGPASMISAGIVNDDLRKAVAIVGRIHGDGELPAIPMRIAPLGGHSVEPRGRRGELVVDEGTGLPVTILVEAGYRHRVFAAIHEIGHFLDLCGTGQSGLFASSSEPMLDEWRRLIVGSRSVRQLLELGRSLPEPSDRRFIAYLLEPIEAWARSYTQYVVRRSGRSTWCAEAAIRVWRHCSTRFAPGVRTPLLCYLLGRRLRPDRRCD